MRLSSLLASLSLLALSVPAAAQPIDYAAQALEALKTSVATPTVAGRGKVPELAAYYAKILTDAGFAASDIEITPVGETAMFAATLKGRDPNLKPVGLIGHMDVVEADPKDWERDPFTPVIENNLLFGRGASDNKYDVTMMVVTLARLKREGFKPRRSVILLLSGDEETGMATTKALAAKYKGLELLLNGDAGGGLISEDGKPSYFALQAAEKTYVDFDVTFTDAGGHSSRPGKVNAITDLANALAKVGAYRFPPMQNELTRSALTIAAKKIGGELGAAMDRYVKDPTDLAAADIISAEPAYIGQVRTTCVNTMVNAGHAPNALPQRASANINCRLMPGVSIETAKADLVRIIDDPRAVITIKGDPIASDASPLRKDVMDAITGAVHARVPGLQIIPAMSPGATDSLHFRAAGVPSYGVASKFNKASDDYAHGLNERVPIDTIPAALEQWRSVIMAIAK